MSFTIRKFDYLVVDCGYTWRLQKHLNEIRENLEELPYCDCKCICDDQKTCDLCANNTCKKCLNEKIVLLYNNLEFKTTPVENVIRKCGSQEDIKYILEALTPSQIFGSIVFKCHDLPEAFDLVKMLTKFRHCGCFSKVPYEMNLIEKDNKKVLIMQFDTESG